MMRNTSVPFALTVFCLPGVWKLQVHQSHLDLDMGRDCRFEMAFLGSSWCGLLVFDA